MQREINALKDNETWFITKLPPNKKALECEWVYKIKYNVDGNVRTSQSRLVLGNHQVQNVD